MPFRFLTLSFSILAILFSIALTTPNATAATGAAVVNIQTIMRDSKAANAIRTQVQNKQKEFQTELDAKESELQKEDQELAKQRSVLAQDAFEKKYREFRQKAADAQSLVRAKKAKLDKGFTQALASIQQKVTEITSAVAKEKGYNMALSSSQVIYTDPSLDITQEVLSRLNSQMPSITVNFE